MPTASATSPMMPPRASTSRTRWPLATPPTAGLQLICAIRSRFMVISAVFSPMRAAAIAASHPACPAPTTSIRPLVGTYLILVAGAVFGSHVVETVGGAVVGKRSLRVGGGAVVERVVGEVVG